MEEKNKNLPVLEKTLGKSIINPLITAIASLISKMDAQELKKIPYEGPMLVVVNHVNFLDAPLLAPRIYPRQFTAMAKAGSWENPLFRFLFNIWEFIPLKREESDIVAMKTGMRVLENNKLLGIFPEGTRTGDGRLIQGKPGTTVLATHTKTPILPLAIWGHETYREDLKKLKRFQVHTRVGNPFYVKELDRKEKKIHRQAVTDQIMYQLAGILPPQYRGFYADQANASQDLLVFPPNSASNLDR